MWEQPSEERVESSSKDKKEGQEIGKEDSKNLSSIKQELSHSNMQGKTIKGIMGRRVSEEWGHGFLVQAVSVEK